MKIKVATWNINSVRLRQDLVGRFLQDYQPDILCLQETKCPEGQFPAKTFAAQGYHHIAERGQSGYHGSAIISKLPFTSRSSKQFCGKDDARHVQVTVSAGKPLTIHSFYVPAGGDVPDPRVNEKFAHKLQFLDEMAGWLPTDQTTDAARVIVTGDLNIAPLENDVWSHRQLLKVVSHTPVEVERLNKVQSAGGWIDAVRAHVPADQKLYTWWSYRAKDWSQADKGRRLDHIWLNPALSGCCTRTEVLREARGWERPSDHVPVIAEIDV